MAIASVCLGTGIRPRKKKIKLHQHPTISTTLETAHSFFVQQVINSLTRLSEYHTSPYPHTPGKMPKRKLEEVSGPARSSDTRKMSIHGTRLTQMFENGVLMIMRGLKTSRGFERQKLSRREKTAKQQKDEKALARLKEEIETLKVCSYCHCGHADGIAEGLRPKTRLLIFGLTGSRLPCHIRAIPVQATYQNETNCRNTDIRRVPGRQESFSGWSEEYGRSQYPSTTIQIHSSAEGNARDYGGYSETTSNRRCAD